jgi:hypothetical protein
MTSLLIISIVLILSTIFLIIRNEWLKRRVKEVFWKDSTSYYYRISSTSSDRNYIRIFKKISILKYEFFLFIKENSVYYYTREISNISDIKSKLIDLIGDYLKEQEKVKILKHDWDGELFEPNQQVKRDRKINKILNNK